MVFIDALLTISRKQMKKFLDIYLIDNEMWYIYTVEYYSDVKETEICR